MMSTQTIYAITPARSSMPVPLDRSADTRAITELTHRLAESWNRHDGAAYASSFTPDSDYVAFDGTHLRGREANARHHQQLFDTVLRGSRLVFEGEPVIRFIGPDTAVMHAMGSVVMPWQQGVRARRRSKQTFVLVRTPAGWQVTAFHNTRCRPLALPRGAKLRFVLLAMAARTLFSAYVTPSGSVKGDRQ